MRTVIFPVSTWFQQQALERVYVATTLLLNKEWAIGTMWTKREFIQEEWIDKSFLSRNTCHELNRITENVIKIVEWLLFESRAQWQASFRLIHPHQRLVFWQFSVQESCKMKTSYSEDYTCYRFCCVLLDDYVLSSEHIY